MSKHTTIYEEPISAQGPRSRDRPLLSYKAAMSKYAIGSDGVIRTVRDVHTADFADLVEQCIKTAEDPEACAKELRGLSYFERVDRWYALCELSRYGATIPVFDDQASAQEYQRTEERRKADV